jgi:hypothetical protein
MQGRKGIDAILEDKKRKEETFHTLVFGSPCVKIWNEKCSIVRKVRKLFALQADRERGERREERGIGRETDCIVLLNVN